MKKIKISYLLDQIGRKKSIMSGGNGRELQIVEADLTPDMLDLVHVSRDGSLSLRLADKISTDVEICQNDRPCIRFTKRFFYFGGPQTTEQLLAWERERRKQIAAKKLQLQTDLDLKLKEYEMEKVIHKDEKAKWIAGNGSDFLKKAIDAGHNCQRRYVTERANRELPGYVLDFENEADWKDRSCPSESAFRETVSLCKKGYNAQVVWLIGLPWSAFEQNDFWGDEFEPREAVLIKNYLGKYLLLRVW